LQLKRDIPDFVKEQRALVGQFKPADPLGDGAGEGASLMAEQLAFEQPVGIAAQFILTKVRSRRLLRLWIARAMSSLPVPVSP